MNRLPFILTATLSLAAAAGYWAHHQRPVPSVPSLPAVAAARARPAALHPGAFQANSDQEAIFKRAFWRRPAPDDRILHAEARQWTDSTNGDVLHWQWFVAVEAGPGLWDWLRHTNPFSLLPADSPAMPSAPSWFPADSRDLEVFRGGAGGSLMVAYSLSGRTIYAAAEGKGLSPAASGVASIKIPTATATSRGRLPDSPPPNPASR